MARLDTLIQVHDIVCVDLNGEDELVDVELLSFPQVTTGNCWVFYQESTNHTFYVDRFLYIYRNPLRPKLVAVPIGPNTPTK